VNAFLELADKQISAPRKAQMRATAKRAAKAEKALAERQARFRLGEKAHRERHAALLAGPHGEAARNLAAFLEAMTWEDAPALVERVRRYSWANADQDTRLLVLAMVDDAIIALRERAGMVPFDDDLAEPPNSAFLIIRGPLL